MKWARERDRKYIEGVSPGRRRGIVANPVPNGKPMVKEDISAKLDMISGKELLDKGEFEVNTVPHPFFREEFVTLAEYMLDLSIDDEMLIKHMPLLADVLVLLYRGYFPTNLTELHVNKFRIPKGVNKIPVNTKLGICMRHLLSKPFDYECVQWLDNPEGIKFVGFLINTTYQGESALRRFSWWNSLKVNTFCGEVIEVEFPTYFNKLYGKLLKWWGNRIKLLDLAGIKNYDHAYFEEVEDLRGVSGLEKYFVNHEAPVF